MHNDDQYPTGDPEITHYQSKAGSLIQLPNKTGEAAKLTEKNMMPRSLSSVQNRHANSRLKAILSNNHMDTSVKLSQRESKSYRRNNNPLSMDANNSHGQTHQVILDESNHIKPSARDLIRNIESPTPP